MHYPLDTKFVLPRSEIETFRIIHQLLAAGETLPVYKNGKLVGKGTACTLNDEGYWAFDQSKMYQEKPATISFSLRFMMEKPIDLVHYDIHLKPICYEYRNEKTKEFIFALVVCVKLELTLKPEFQLKRKED